MDVGRHERSRRIDQSERRITVGGHIYTDAPQLEVTMFAKPLLFLSSYAPLFAILALRIEDTWIRIVAAGLAAAGVAALIAVLNLDRRSARAGSTITSVRNAGAEASSYLAGYLLPFLTVSQPTTTDVVAYVLFLGIVGVVTVKTGVIQVNPLLFVFRYSVFQVTDATGAEYYLLSKRKIRAGEEVTTTSLNDDVRVDRVEQNPR
jgi:hypothetical protein